MKLILLFVLKEYYTNPIIPTIISLLFTIFLSH